MRAVNPKVDQVCYGGSAVALDVACVVLACVAGFEVAVVGLDRPRVDPMIYERSWTVREL